MVLSFWSEIYGLGPYYVNRYSRGCSPAKPFCGFLALENNQDYRQKNDF